MYPSILEQLYFILRASVVVTFTLVLLHLLYHLSICLSYIRNRLFDNWTESWLWFTALYRLRELRSLIRHEGHPDIEMAVKWCLSDKDGPQTRDELIIALNKDSK